MEINYVGEHLLPGKIGQFLVILSFVAAIVSAIGFSFATNSKDEHVKSGWHRLSKLAFFVNGLSILGIVGTLFYIISGHYFEYHYAWQHSNPALPSEYLISCF